MSQSNKLKNKEFQIKRVHNIKIKLIYLSNSILVIKFLMIFHLRIFAVCYEF